MIMRNRVNNWDAAPRHTFGDTNITCPVLEAASSNAMQCNTWLTAAIGLGGKLGWLGR